MHWIYLIHKFHNLSWITEINELFHDILIYWDAFGKHYIYIYCDESAASPLIISTPRPLIAALHQAPDGSGCVREEGRWNSQVWRRVMRHTWSKWSLITAAVICRLRLSSGDRSLPPCMHAGVLVGPGRERRVGGPHPWYGWRARMPGRTPGSTAGP